MENKPKYLEASQKTVIVDVSSEEYQADLRKGLAEDETLAPGRHVFRRGGFLRRHADATIATATSPKVRISINLDADILEYFKNRALDPDSAPYQTQINNALRSVMETAQGKKSTAQSIYLQSLLADSQFIDAVAKRVAEQRPEYKTD